MAFSEQQGFNILLAEACPLRLTPSTLVRFDGDYKISQFYILKKVGQSDTIWYSYLLKHHFPVPHCSLQMGQVYNQLYCCRMTCRDRRLGHLLRHKQFQPSFVKLCILCLAKHIECCLGCSSCCEYRKSHFHHTPSQKVPH